MSDWKALSWKDIPEARRHLLCDQEMCGQLATRIIHTKRANTPTVQSYWCETHRPTVTT